MTNNSCDLIIAIDGTTASGKGTLARRLAQHFNLAYLDTGKLYRLVAYKAFISNIELTNHQALQSLITDINPNDINDPALANETIGQHASIISSNPMIRQALFAFQRQFAHQPGGSVLDGRDIATVICPEADIKLYVDAIPEKRAERRFFEEKAQGRQVSYDDILSKIHERDNRDKNRKEAPLKKSDDAILLDTTELDIEMAFLLAKEIVEQKKNC